MKTGRMPEMDRLSEEAVQLLRKLAVIPAPSGHEEKRADFVWDCLKLKGVSDALIDSALNVVVPIHVTEDNSLTVFFAHSDVVFPDTEMLPLKEEDGRLCCPGIGDNSANAAVLMTAAASLVNSGFRPKDGGILVVINSGEEGLGNLKGARRIMKDYGSRIRRFISFDSTSAEIVCSAVGSMRYEVVARTEGGHSFRDFGKRNAIETMAAMIEEAYSVRLPKKGKTTYNVGRIEGGTSVNSIAQEARALFEFRSDREESLGKMEKRFGKILESFRSRDAEITAKLIGERPCAHDVDEKKQKALVKMAEAAVRKAYGEKPYRTSGSTDCNIFLAEGIPSVCLGLCRGKGAHTREEYILTDSIRPGTELAWNILSEC